MTLSAVEPEDVPAHAPGCPCCAPTAVGPRASRRRLLGVPIGIGALAALGVGMAGGVPRAAAATVAPPSPAATPDAAVAALMAGNRRYAASRLGVCTEDLQAARHETEHHQAPFAAVLSCADSRVPVELVFDQGVGRIFVVRVAGNIAAPEMIASLEYGVAVLGTRAIVVLGHGNCGAVKATLARTAAPGQISALYAFIRPAVDRAGTDVDKAIRINAVMQAGLLAQASPVLAGAIAEQRLRVLAAYYDVGSGKVSLLGG
jgi:carbonic anhydrase